MPNNDAVSFSVDIIGDFTGDKWVGQFKAKPRLSYRDQLKEDQIRRELLGKDPDQASAEAKNYSRLFAGLTVRLVDAPKWWAEYNDGLDLLDDNLIVDIYEKTMAIAKAAATATISKGEEAKTDLAKEEKPEKK